MILTSFTSPQGNKVIIRKAQEEDADNIIRLAKIILHSFPEFVLTKPEEFTMTPDQEKEWIRTMNSAETSFLAVAEIGASIIGMINFETGKKKKVSHAGEFAIGLHPDYTDQKAGTALLQCLVDWAKKHPKIEKLILNVNENNGRAIHLYQKFGFVTEGRNLKALKLNNGNHLTNLQMALFVK